MNQFIYFFKCTKCLIHTSLDGTNQRAAVQLGYPQTRRVVPDRSSLPELLRTAVVLIGLLSLVCGCFHFNTGLNC